MKHLKTYENNNIKINEGDYIIWTDYGIDIEILEVTRIDDKSKIRYWSRIIYTYSDKKGLVFINSSGESFFTLDDLENIKYKSDNIDDCIKYISIIDDSNKYNL